jgi:hypothetical protein
LVHETLTLNSYIEDVDEEPPWKNSSLWHLTHYRHLAAIAEMMMRAELQKKRSCEEMLEDFIAAREYPKVTEIL